MTSSPGGFAANSAQHKEENPDKQATISCNFHQRIDTDMSKASQSTNWRSKVSPPPSIDHQAPPKSSSRWRPNHDHDKATARYNKSVPGARIANGQNTKSEDDAQTQTAIAEGRRLYVGNMPYLAKGQDVSATFSAAGFEM